MVLIVLTLLLAVSPLAWTRQLTEKQKGGSPRDNGCHYPFEPVGSGCYYFSEEKRNYYGASKYCETLTNGDAEVKLAVLDYDEDEDQAVLSAATAKNNWFWLGGQMDEDDNWKWEDGRMINMRAPIWLSSEPNEPSNRCLATNLTNAGGLEQRSNLYDFNCGESINFICQSGCPFDYRLIETKCYFISEELGLEHVSWAEARDYCRSMEMPSGYHADLAVFGLEGQNDYTLMAELLWGFANTSTEAWIGASTVSGCDYRFVDGRSLPISSVLWDSDDPDCGSETAVWLYHYSTFDRAYLRTDGGISTRPFVCQMFPDE